MCDEVLVHHIIKKLKFCRCVCTVVFQKFKWNAEFIKWKWQEKNYVCVVCIRIVHVVFEVSLLAVGIAAEGNVLH